MAHNEQYELPFSENLTQQSSWVNTRPITSQVEYWLRRQPTSYALYYTCEEMIERVYRGELIPWLYMREWKEMGLILLRVLRANGIKILQIEFLSCENIFAMAEALKFLEGYAANAGFEMIEAVAHKTIASAAVKRHGYTSPYQVIYKRLGTDDA